jgi:triosephosphate isomerase
MGHNLTVVANWKMNTNLADATIMAQEVRDMVENLASVDVIIAPPAVWLYPIAEIFAKHKLRNLSLYAQNISEFDDGPHTGEVSAKMIKSLVSGTLIGHSERMMFGENEKTSNAKLKEALKNNLRPIVFVSEVQRGNNHEVGERTSLILDGISKKDYDKITLAYEPVWAISTNKNAQPATLDEITKGVAKIRSIFGADSQVHYGGSVNIDNIGELTHARIIDGVVIGSASLKIKEFLKIIQLSYIR